MSERMLELANRAGLKKDHASDREYIGDFDWRLFGELLVRECANIVNSLEQYEGEGDCSTAEYIKERFGVE